MTGPKGGTIAPHAPASRVGKLLPGWVKRYKQVKVSVATSTAPHPSLTQRQLVVQFCQWAIANTGRIHYAEIRPIPQVVPGGLPRLPFTTDCSGFATMAYQFAGAADPNGAGFKGTGYTGTLLAHLKRVPLSKVRPGDIAIFGCKSYANGHHAAVVTSVIARTLAGVGLASHGSEHGPLPITAAAEAKYQPDGAAGIVFLTDPRLK